MSVRNSLFTHLLHTLDNFDIESYDEKLVRAITFINYNDLCYDENTHALDEFEKYIEDNKLLMTEKFYKSIMDLFVCVNFEHIHMRELDHPKYTHDMDFYLDGLLKYIKSTGYVLTMTDVMHFPYVGRFLEVSDVIQDNNEQTLNKIKTLIKHGPFDLYHIVKFLLECNNDYIKLYARMITFDGSDSQIKNMYKNISIKPHEHHMLTILNNMPCYAVKTFKSIIDFYDSHNITVYEDVIYSIRGKIHLDMSKVPLNTQHTVMDYLKNTRSYLKQFTSKTDEEIDELIEKKKKSKSKPKKDYKSKLRPKSKKAKWKK